MLDDLQRRLRTAGLDYPHREWVKGADDARHVCLLSRFPIVERNSQDDVRFELDGKTLRMNRGIFGRHRRGESPVSSSTRGSALEITT